VDPKFGQGRWERKNGIRKNRLISISWKGVCFLGRAGGFRASKILKYLDPDSNLWTLICNSAFDLCIKSGSGTSFFSWASPTVSGPYLQFCGSRMFIPDPNFFHPDPNFFHPGSASKNLSILTKRIVAKLSEI
jgi:hypothetical protein